jgi:hypothetical protein
VRQPGLALLLVLTTVIHRPSYTVQAAAGYAPYSDITGRVVTVTAGEQYAAGPLRRALLGEHYRDLWTTPVQVPLLDLESHAGGLTPEELGGGLQTRSLKLKSADGREFAFRRVDKDPSEALAPAYRGTVVDRLVQDATSAANPAAPKEGFAGSSDVMEWDELLERLEKDTSHRVDVEEFLRARLVDDLLGDWDRHRDQWRWAGFKAGRRTIWRPIPRDRDQALVRYDGALLEIARKVHPKLVNFGPEYPSVLGLAWNAQELDRRLLASLNGERFRAVAESVRLAVTDSVIESAIDRVPAAYREVSGAWLAEALRQRRDALPAHAEDLYRMLAQEVDLTGSDGTDIVVARRDSLGRLDLVVTSATGVDTLFERTFEPGGQPLSPDLECGRHVRDIRRRGDGASPDPAGADPGDRGASRRTAGVGRVPL